MFNTIYKYPLEITSNQTIQLPKNASILCAKNQDDNLIIWAMVDSSAELEDRQIEVFGTGHPIPKCKNDTQRFWLNSVIINSLVWHIFEVY